MPQELIDELWEAAALCPPELERKWAGKVLKFRRLADDLRLGFFVDRTREKLLDLGRKALALRPCPGWRRWIETMLERLEATA